MLYTHVAAGIIGAAVAFGGAWQVQNWRYGEQIATMKKDASEAKEKAVEDALEDERKDRKRVDDALIEANKRAQYNAAAAATARTTANSLRDELATARAGLPSISCEASREYAARLSDVFGACTARLTEVAKRSDEAANAAMTLDQAWPDD